MDHIQKFLQILANLIFTRFVVLALALRDAYRIYFPTLKRHAFTSQKHDPDSLNLFLKNPTLPKKIETRTCLCSYKLQVTTNLRLTCAWLSFSCICVWPHPLFWTKLTSIFYSHGDSPIRNLAISVISRSAFSCDIGHRK